MNRDINCVDDAEIFSRKSELEHMQEIRESAEDPFYVQKRVRHYFSGEATGSNWEQSNEQGVVAVRRINRYEDGPDSN